MTKHLQLLVATGLILTLGCGGKNTVSTVSGATIPITGETNQGSGTSESTVTGPGDANVNVGGTTETGKVPEGTTVTPGEIVAFFPAGSGFIGAAFANDTEIRMNGRRTGVFLSKVDGKLLQNLIVPVGPCVFTVGGATIQGGPRGSSLGPVGTVAIRGQVFADGSSSIPLKISGVVPGNGETTLGATITLTMHPSANGKTVELRVVHANGIVQKVATVAGGMAVISEINSEGFIENASTLELTVR